MRQKIKNFLIQHQLETQAWQAIAAARKIKQRLLWPLDMFLYYSLQLLPDSYRIKIRGWSALVKKMDYSRELILLHIDSTKEYGSRRHSAAKEPETVAWIEQYIKKGEVLYDIGACVGAYSLVAAKYFKHDISVYAFEPGFQNFAQLVKNISLNGCESSITPLPIALGDKTDMAVFLYRNLATGSASHALADNTTKEPFHPALRQRILSYRLDDLINQFNLPKPHHIKLDVDGAEMTALAGMAQTLDSSILESVLIETENTKTKIAVQAFLSGKGLHLEKSYPKKGSEMCNCIFIKKIGPGL